jgi:2C-methyl-D-erythritol 2,4-cyclodiphosphate synthase
LRKIHEQALSSGDASSLAVADAFFSGLELVDGETDWLPLK